jgi:hypothetical protein
VRGVPGRLVCQVVALNIESPDVAAASHACPASCRWCHRASTPTAVMLNPTAATVLKPAVIETTGRVAPVRGVGLREFPGEALREDREFSLPGPCPLSPRLARTLRPGRDLTRASGASLLTPGIRALTLEAPPPSPKGPVTQNDIA